MDRKIDATLAAFALITMDDDPVDDYLEMWSPDKPERSKEEQQRLIEEAAKKRARRAAKRAALV